MLVSVTSLQGDLSISAAELVTWADSEVASDGSRQALGSAVNPDGTANISAEVRGGEVWRCVVEVQQPRGSNLLSGEPSWDSDACCAHGRWQRMNAVQCVCNCVCVCICVWCVCVCV